VVFGGLAGGGVCGLGVGFWGLGLEAPQGGGVCGGGLVVETWVGAGGWGRWGGGCFWFGGVGGVIWGGVGGAPPPAGRGNSQESRATLWTATSILRSRAGGETFILGPRSTKARRTRSSYFTGKLQKKPARKRKKTKEDGWGKGTKEVIGQIISSFLRGGRPA